MREYCGTFLVSRNRCSRTQKKRLVTTLDHRLRRPKSRPNLSGMPVIVPEDFEDFYRLINTPGRIIFVLMYAWWCYGSQNTMPTYEILSDEFPNCIFIKVEIEEVSDVPRIYDLDSTPAFMFFRNGGRADTFLGGNRERLEQFIRKWAR